MYFSHLGITFAVTIYNNLILLKFSRFSTSSCFRLLDPNAQNQYDVFLMSYANILYHWGYTNNSKLVLKFMTHLPEPHTGIGMITKACLLCLSLFYMMLSLVWRLVLVVGHCMPYGLYVNAISHIGILPWVDTHLLGELIRIFGFWVYNWCNFTPHIKFHFYSIVILENLHLLLYYVFIFSSVDFNQSDLHRVML